MSRSYVFGGKMHDPYSLSCQLVTGGDCTCPSTEQYNKSLERHLRLMDEYKRDQIDKKERELEKEFQVYQEEQWRLEFLPETKAFKKFVMRKLAELLGDK